MKLRTQQTLYLSLITAVPNLFLGRQTILITLKAVITVISVVIEIMVISVTIEITVIK